MFHENIREFFKDLWEIIKRIVTSRVIPFIIVGIVLFGFLVYRLFVLQIVNGDTYTANYTLKTQRTITTTGTRGNIYDCNGVLLAYSDLAYNITISDVGYYSSTKVRNSTLNGVINKMVDIIEKNGDTIDYDFHIRTDEKGYYYDISDNALLRFLRDVYGHSAISELTEQERHATALETVEYLAKRYSIDLTECTKQRALQIIYIRYNMTSNLYQRYVTLTVASNVSKETMASILENEDSLIGVSIEDTTLRHYNYSVCMAHILGYTGKISESELDELKLVDDSYDASDIIGKSGIEAEFETTLSGTKGYTTVLVDSVGRVQEVVEQVDPQPGEDVYLTIDVEYQQEIYNLLERRLAEILVTNIVNSDSTYNPDSGMITLPVVEAYNALINNGLISMEKIAASNTESATQVYSVFCDRKTQVLTDIRNELNTGTEFKNLSSGMKSYMKQVRNLLIQKSILNTDNILSTDDLSVKWSDGEISLRAYLEGAIHNDWVNIYNLDVKTDYPSYDEVLEAIIEEAMNEISSDETFDKLIYEELILNRTISGKQICLILMEQDCISYTESEYVNIQNGGSTYDFLMNKIRNLSITPQMLALDPCSGSVVVENPNDGRLIAMVTYPSYDDNYFSGSIDAAYYSKLLADQSSPLLNRATQTKLAPGSTFKPLMTIAGLNEGVITPDTIVECTGIFDKVTPNIKCHVYPKYHGEENIYTALRDSCNVYFCEVGYRLSCMQSGVLNHDYGLSVIRKYADTLGLSSKTGIELPETNPQVSDYNSVVSSIGQGTHAYTSLQMARYLSTIANRGTVYNTSIVLKTTDIDGNVTSTSDPEIYSYTEYPSWIWDTLQIGMKEAVNGYFKDLSKNLPVQIYGKSGTAQEDKNRGNHAVFMMYAKDGNDQPEVAIVSMLPYAYAATNAGIMDYYAMCAYYGIDIPQFMAFDNYSIIIRDT